MFYLTTQSKPFDQLLNRHMICDYKRKTKKQINYLNDRDRFQTDYECCNPVHNTCPTPRADRVNT